MRIIMRPTRSIAPSCSAFAIIWPRADPTALANGIRKMSASVSGIAGSRIIDLSERGAQPMMSADGKLVVTFNGEIYNYRELRASLEAKGRRFRTQTDTEVLLHLYAEKGEAMVEDLRGMFAFGLWDAEKKALFCWRGIPTASSRCIMPTMAGPFALHPRSRRCWQGVRSPAIRSRQAGLDFVCSAAFRNHLRPIRKSARCRRVRHFGWIASALASQSSIFPSPMTYCRAEDCDSRP